MANQKTNDLRIEMNALRLAGVFSVISVLIYTTIYAYTKGLGDLSIIQAIITLFFSSMILLCVFFIFWGIFLSPLMVLFALLIDAFKRPSDKENDTTSSAFQAVTDKPDNNNDNMFAWLLVFLMFLGIFWPSDDSNDDG
ncbi:MAG: hypothetical protein IJD28_00450 [Deferribacterales bacterium]|nr:hypothetical protein [Deferribacterales bacterium]